MHDGSSADASADPVRAERGEPTREALIQVADRLFAESGYQAVSTDDIVRRAQVTRGALYHHFRDKEDLFAAVFERIEQEVVGELARKVEAIEDPWELLVVGLRAFLDDCSEPRILRIAYTEGPAVLGMQRWREVHERYGLQLLVATLQRAIDAGVIRGSDPVSLGHLLHGSLAEAAVLIADAEDPKRVREQVEESLLDLLEGLRVQRADQ